MKPRRERVDFFRSCKHAEVHWAVFLSKGSGAPGPGFRLYGVTARRLVPGGELGARLETLCSLGLKGVQVREKDLDETELARFAGNLSPLFKRHGTAWLVNSSVAVAELLGADGVQLAASQPVAQARAKMGEGALIGKSVHSVDEARNASAEGADFIVFGPVFSTPEKDRFGSPQGLDKLREACGKAARPVFAIGGITPSRARDCREAGAYGVAVMSALMFSPDPGKLLAEYGAALGSL